MAGSPASAGPAHPATAYVGNLSPDSVIPANTVPRTAGQAISVGSYVVGFAVAPDGKVVYADVGSGAVVPIRTATNTAGKAIMAGGGQFSQIAITPDGKTVYVTDPRLGTVTPISTATGTAGRPIKVGKDPSSIAITPDGKTAYVVN